MHFTCTNTIMANMSDLQDILRSIDDLSIEDKLVVRNVLDDVIKASAGERVANPRGDLVGLFANDANAFDGVLKAIYETRELPLRIE
jgi:hypothetical protein